MLESYAAQDSEQGGCQNWMQPRSTSCLFSMPSSKTCKERAQRGYLRTCTVRGRYRRAVIGAALRPGVRRKCMRCFSHCHRPSQAMFGELWWWCMDFVVVVSDISIKITRKKITAFGRTTVLPQSAAKTRAKFFIRFQTFPTRIR